MDNKLEIIGAPNVFRYRSSTNYVIDELKNHYMYFPDKNELNDPFDTHPGLINLTSDKDEISKAYTIIAQNISEPKVLEYYKRTYNKDSIRDFINENIDKYIEKFGIACFSLRWFNMPLWASYAENHKGLCLHFDANLDLKFFGGLRLVEYEEKPTPKEFKPVSNQEIIDLFFRKNTQWKNEEELRLIKHPKGKHQFQKEALRTIFLGFNIEKNFKEHILKVAKSIYPHARVYQMKKPSQLNKVSLVKI